jgi:hypothetical protein
MTSCQQPYGRRTATRWPAARPSSGRAERTPPAASMPGVNGSGCWGTMLTMSAEADQPGSRSVRGRVDARLPGQAY